MRNWVLPPWFRDQNNPFKGNYMAGETGFYNYSNRSWTRLRADSKAGSIRVDGFGIIDLGKPKASIEIWLYHDARIYHPGSYVQLARRFSATEGVMALHFDFGAGILPVKIGPMIVFGRNSLGIEIGHPRMRQPRLEPGEEAPVHSFEPLMVWLVLRPYGSDGLSQIRQMEYSNGFLLANRVKLLRFSEEPQFCFFTNAARGDVTQFFRLWEGNAKIEAADGSCTGMVGFTAARDNRHTVKIAIENRKAHVFRPDFTGIHWLSRFFTANPEVTRSLAAVTRAKLRTGTRLDELYPTAIRHLITFCPEKTHDVYQIMVFNRLGLWAESLGLLTVALRKVRWDGQLAGQFIGGQCLIWAVADYYKITGNQALIKKYWPVLKQVGNWLCYQSGFMDAGSQIKPPQNTDPVQWERMLWLCGSLQSITELGMVIDKNREVQLFKDYFLVIWAKLLDRLTATNRKAAPPGSNVYETGAEIGVRSLQALFPLQFTGRGTPWVCELLHRIRTHHLWRGGFYSLQDFQGVSLELTARLGQALIREGLEYRDVLNFLLDAAGPAYSWPDRINPITGEGIGEEGHDPKVLYQILLLVRNLFFCEEQEDLHLLPGLFISRFWQNPNLELIDWPTFFGTVSVKVRTIGGVTQINFKPEFRRRPQKILLTFGGEYRLLYTDANIQWNGKTLLLNPDFQVLRLRNNACLDNTFGHTL